VKSISPQKMQFQTTFTPAFVCLSLYKTHFNDFNIVIRLWISRIGIGWFQQAK